MYRRNIQKGVVGCTVEMRALFGTDEGSAILRFYVGKAGPCSIFIRHNERSEMLAVLVFESYTGIHHIEYILRNS